MKKLLLILLLGLSLIIPVSTYSANDNIALFVQGRHIAQPVDWQTWCGDCVSVDYTTGSPWTINPGWISGYTPPIIGKNLQTGGEKSPGCLWDSDDSFDYTTVGNTFPAQTTLTATECRWRDFGTFNHGGVHNYFKFSSTSPNLNITIKWDWGTGSTTYTVLPPTLGSKNLWDYKACLTNPQAQNGVKVPVPNSHDGFAMWEVITVSITNTGRSAGKSGGIFGAGWINPSIWCDSFTQV